MYKILFLICLFVVGSCTSKKVDKQIKSDKTGDTTRNRVVESKASDCDSSLWLHVWRPSRLEVHQNCITATGTIAKLKAEDDGDAHILLDLDKGQENLLNKGNYIDKKGYLVVEVVCVNDITDKKAIGICDGYTNSITIPKVGDHVKVTGSYVLDTHNDWMEIHPVSKIELIK